MTEDEKTGTRQLKSVIQAFDIIEYLRENGSATLSEIATDFDMPMSTAHIHLSTLVESGYIAKQDGEYRCSLLFLRTGGQLRDQTALYQAAKSEIDDLRDRVGEIANLGAEENGYLVQLYKSESPESIDDNAPLGAHLYLHMTATGKAILSQLPEQEISSILEKRGLPEFTDETITDRENLLDELRETRERGYAINRGEHYAGVCAIGAPILSNSADVLGAISISGPLSRIRIDRIEDDLAPELLDKKNIIELKLKQFK